MLMDNRCNRDKLEWFHKIEQKFSFAKKKLANILKENDLLKLQYTYI